MTGNSPPLPVGADDASTGPDTGSRTSFASHASSVPTTNFIPSPSLSTPNSASSILPRDSAGRDSLRPRQREMKEWSQVCAVWQQAPVSAGGGGLSASTSGMLSKVQGVRKLGKRESSHHVLSPAEALLYGMDEPGGPAKDRKGSSKDKGGASKKDGTWVIGPSSATKEGNWRRATSVLRDDGLMTIFSEDKIVLHSVHLDHYNRSDIRLVDTSIFGRANCVVVHRPSYGLPTAQRSPEEGIYLYLPSRVAIQTWLVMSHCFAQPSFYNALTSGQNTPRMMIRSRSSAQWPVPDQDSDEDPPTTPDQAAIDLSSCRIFRSLVIAINEGRALGEHGTETFRAGSKAPERRACSDGDNISFVTAQADGLSLNGHGSTHENSSPAKGKSSKSDKSEKDDDKTIDSFCELLLDGDLLARTAVRKGTNAPFWNESFTFSDLPALSSPVVINVFRTHKSSAPSLIGAASVRLADLPRAELIEDWWPVKPVGDFRGRTSDVVGELSLSMRVGEEVVLPTSEYEPVLSLLQNDDQAELASAITCEFPSDLEELTKLLVRIYQAQRVLLPRILRLAELEVGGNTKTAAILFRGNTILTKSVELYMRLIGTEYLDASVGNVIRKLCADKVEVEIDPSRMKPGFKDKELQHNVHSLHDWTLAVWNAIYDAREKCPNDIRQIFGHIQHVVAAKYDGDEQKNTRWTSVSAFVFLRFFVPAVLNPKLFALVREPPDSKSQRTLTLVAKTLQGLANFSSFGQKEPWMLPMNGFVQDNTAAFVDFIEHISTPGASAGARQEWTSPTSVAYVTPYRLRDQLPPLAREGIPRLPHLLDLPRDVGMLAAHVARGVADKPGSAHAAMSDTASIGPTPSVRSVVSATRHPKFTELVEACVAVHDEAKRRGGGLVLPGPGEARAPAGSIPLAGVSPRRARAATTGREPRTPNYPTRPGGLGWGDGQLAQPGAPPRPSTPPTRPQSDVLHIRSPKVPADASLSPIGAEERGGSAALRKSNRSRQIIGMSPQRSGARDRSSPSIDDLHAVFGADGRDPSPGPSARPSFASERSFASSTLAPSEEGVRPSGESLRRMLPARTSSTDAGSRGLTGRAPEGGAAQVPSTFDAFQAVMSGGSGGGGAAMRPQLSTSSWASIPSSSSSVSIVADAEGGGGGGGGYRMGRRGSTQGFGGFAGGLLGSRSKEGSGSGSGDGEDEVRRKGGWAGLGARMVKKGSKGQ